METEIIKTFQIIERKVSYSNFKYASNDFFFLNLIRAWLEKIITLCPSFCCVSLELVFAADVVKMLKLK